MRIGRIHITRVKRNAAGLEIYPWQRLTEDRVTPELREVVAKVARSEAKSYFQQLREEEAPCVRPCYSKHEHIAPKERA